MTEEGAEAVTVFLDLLASVEPGYPALEMSAAVAVAVAVAAVEAIKSHVLSA